MKGVVELLDVLGKIIFWVGVAVVAILIFQFIIGGLPAIGCDAKKTEAMRTVLDDALKQNSFNSVNFTLPDCVDSFKAPGNSYCFKEPSKDYACTDLSNEGIVFNVPEITRGSYCFYVYGANSLGNPNKASPTVLLSRSGAC